MIKLIDSALLAARVHFGVPRKFTREPYINHPRRVFLQAQQFFNEVSYAPNKDNALCAAWLHDTLEDGDNPEIIAAEINAISPGILPLVEQLTNPSSKYPGVSRLERKKIDFLHISEAEWAVKVVKIFDRIDNLHNISKCPNIDWAKLYLHESRLLLGYLKGTNEELEQRLDKIISKHEIDILTMQVKLKE